MHVINVIYGIFAAYFAHVLPGLAGELHELSLSFRPAAQLPPGAEGELPRRAQLLTLVSSLMKSMFPGKYLSGFELSCS
jgi:hypothetical protein